MAFIPATNVVAVHIRGSLAGEQTENTLYYLFTTSPSEADIQALVDAISDEFIDSGLSSLPTEWVGREVYGRDLTAEVGAQATNTDLESVTGAGGAGAPNNVTLAIQRSSGMSGRSARGRIYWQGIPTAYIDSTNIADSVMVSNILDNLEAMDLAAIALDFLPVIVSYFTGGAPRAAAELFEIATWKVVDAVLDSQRNRLPGRGS